MMSKESMQIEFDRLVNRGIILGSVWIMGIGSVISLISAFQANMIIKKSGFNIEGRERVVKCMIIGISGLLVWIIAVAIILIFKKK